MSETYLTDEQFLDALKRVRKQIAGGLKNLKDDSTTSGDKYTTCSWGTCTQSMAAYPHPDSHLWPDQFILNQRVAPKYKERRHLCPMDWRNPTKVKDNYNGCFHSCRIFQAKSGRKNRVTQQQALKMYDKRIKFMEDMIAKKKGLSMMPGETVKTGASNVCDCGKEMRDEVCQSGAGYYIGTQCCYLNSRESGYFRTRKDAEAALESGDYGR